MSDTPRVSIILPVYNEEHELARAIARLQNQTFEDCEIVLVDDGSTDGTLVVARSIRDPRLRVVAAQHGGVAAALNCAIRNSRSEFIARQDVDDVSAETRIEKQFEFLRNHPAVGVVGTFAAIVDEASGRRIAPRLPVTDEQIKAALPWRNPFVHSSIMMRKSVITAAGLYRSEFVWEDYDLWLRLRTLTSFANLDEYLVERRVRECGHFRMRRSKAVWNNLKVQWRALADGQLSIPLLSSACLSCAKSLALKTVGE